MAIATLEEGVWQETTSTGTSALDLTAVTGKRTFASAYTNGTSGIPYTIEWVGGFEHGLGTLDSVSSPNKLARNTILRRYDNGSGAINLPIGDKVVYVAIPGSYMVTTERANTFNEHQTMAISKRLYLGNDSDTYLTSDTDDIVLLIALGNELFSLDGVNERARLVSTASAGTAGPELRIARMRAAPADNDQIGVLAFTFQTDTGAEAYAGKIRALVTDVTNGTEDAALLFEVPIAGTSTEIMRLTLAGIIMAASRDIFTAGKTTQDSGVAGAELRSTGQVVGVSSGSAPGIFTRLTNDGTIIQLRQGADEEGNISVSDTTVSYNTFLASHWSVWGTGEKPLADPPHGTLLETVDELCDFKGYLPKVRIAQPGSRRCYGVFAGYDEKNRIMVHAIGAGPKVRFKGRIEGGDLLTTSDEAGIACAQEDDIIRRSTIGWAPVGDSLARDGLLPIIHMAG